MSRASLSNKQQKDICALIISWQGKLTWQALTKAITHDFGYTVTRQTLCTYHAVKKEYDIKKQQKRGVEVVNRTTVKGTEAELIKEVEKLRAEVKQLEATRDSQLAFINNLLSNARAMNVNLAELVEEKGV